jgi:hypothetical protein
VKSYFLEEIASDLARVRSELSKLLPVQTDPWVLFAANADPLAYYDVTMDDQGTCDVQADVSGRHFNEDTSVLEVLRELQKQLGGIVRDDGGNAK